jgi:hypothetical protein
MNLEQDLSVGLERTGRVYYVSHGCGVPIGGTASPNSPRRVF